VTGSPSALALCSARWRANASPPTATVSHKDDQHREEASPEIALAAGGARHRRSWHRCDDWSGDMRHPTCIDCQARSFSRCLGWLLLITVMILAIVTPIWFSAAAAGGGLVAFVDFGLLLLSRGAPGFGDVKLGALLGPPQR
jgi:hypothetical protein